MSQGGKIPWYHLNSAKAALKTFNAGERRVLVGADVFGTMTLFFPKLTGDNDRFSSRKLTPTASSLCFEKTSYPATFLEYADIVPQRKGEVKSLV